MIAVLLSDIRTPFFAKVRIFRVKTRGPGRTNTTLRLFPCALDLLRALQRATPFSDEGDIAVVLTHIFARFLAIVCFFVVGAILTVFAARQYRHQKRSTLKVFWYLSPQFWQQGLPSSLLTSCCIRRVRKTGSNWEQTEISTEETCASKKFKFQKRTRCCVASNSKTGMAWTVTCAMGVNTQHLRSHIWAIKVTVPPGWVSHPIVQISFTAEIYCLCLPRKRRRLVRGKDSPRLPET